jgi:uncharacterized protein YlaI
MTFKAFNEPKPAPQRKPIWIRRIRQGHNPRPELDWCRQCGDYEFFVCWQLVKINGPVVQMRCTVCDTAKERKHDNARDFELPECANYSTNEPCAACGTIGFLELHHWAPRHLFGNDSDNWPTSYLCPDCHQRWHATVTPTMSHRKATA